jgi:hypothetical protein
MANINEIYLVGSDLLCDSEGCLDLLFDNYVISSVAIGILFLSSIAFGYKVGRNYKR